MPQHIGRIVSRALLGGPVTNTSESEFPVHTGRTWRPAQSCMLILHSARLERISYWTVAPLRRRSVSVVAKPYIPAGSTLRLACASGSEAHQRANPIKEDFCAGK
jgi:hypothetical protein